MTGAEQNVSISGREPLVQLSGLSKRFTPQLDIAARIARGLGAATGDGIVYAVDDVDLEVMEGDFVGLVGESGCGKSTVGRMLAGLIEPSEGQVLYRGQDIRQLCGDEKRVASLQVQMIFQDPFASLNPRMRVGDIIGEAPLYHGLVSSGEVENYVKNLMDRVGLDPSYMKRYPHQFSGGQRQRIGIARALAVKPKFIVCDEAVASLDVSVQAQILNLFADLRQEYQLTYLFISHDLGVVEHICDRIVIMYLGRIVEQGPVAELFSNPNHPYTQTLLDHVPQIDARHQQYPVIKGEVPSPLNPPSGCHFHPRCASAFDQCRLDRPRLVSLNPRHCSACFLNSR